MIANRLELNPQRSDRKSSVLTVTPASQFTCLLAVDRADGVNGRRSSGDWKESSPTTSGPGAKVRSVLPGLGRPRSKSDLTAPGDGGQPISVQPRPRRCSYSVQSEKTSEFVVEPDSEGRRSRGLVPFQYILD